MSTNCLVTKLKGSVSSSNIPMLGTLRVAFPVSTNYASPYAKVIFDDITDVKAVWAKGSDTIIRYNDAEKSYRVNTKDVIDDVLLIKPKYNITWISLVYGTGKIWMEDLSGLPKLTNIQFGKGNSGDNIANMPTDLPLTIFDLGELTGDIKHLANYPDLHQITVTNIDNGVCTVGGNLSSISNLSNLTNVIVPTGVSGKITDLKASSDTLITFSKKQADVLDQDASLWANVFKSLQSAQSWNSKVSWNSPSLRDTSCTVIRAAFGFRTATDCDNFLINMAACVNHPENSPGTMYLQNSTRTSASDSAVTTLQNAGYTIGQVTKA